MPGERPSDRDPEAPRRDLPSSRAPDADGSRGTGEEEDAARGRERELEDGEEEDGGSGRGRSAAEDAAGGDREIL